MSVDFTGYHACSQEGEYEYVRSNIPFISGDGDDQWLTQGYYFWYKSSKFASGWTPSEYRKGGDKEGQTVKRVIGKFDVSIPKDKFWDLVGEPPHQEEFESFAQRVLNKYNRTNKQLDDVSVNEVISEMREFAKVYNDAFPYVAVKAVDERKKNVSHFKFSSVPGSAGIGATMATNNAQQVCVFDCAKDSFQLVSFHSPHDYKLLLIKELEKLSEEEEKDNES